MFQAITNTLKTLALAIGVITALALPLAAQDFRVEGAGLEAAPTSYRGPCPGLIKFQGKIQASAAGRVKYTYFRNDGGTGPEGFVDFEGPGVKRVDYTWTLGGPSLTHFEGWVAIRILAPNSYESNRAKFVLDCQGGQGGQGGQDITNYPFEKLCRPCPLDEITIERVLGKPLPDPKSQQILRVLDGEIYAIDQSGGTTLVTVSQGSVLEKYGDLPDMKIVFAKSAGPEESLAKESVIQGLLFQDGKMSMIKGASRLSASKEGNQ